MNSIDQRNKEQELEEIDIIAIVVRLWQKRMFVVKTTAIFALLGLFISIVTPKEYTSTCVMVPQTSGVSMSNSSIGSLAQLAGFSLGSLGNEEALSTAVYVNILNNINFQKELAATPFFFEEYDREITLLDYFSLPEYEKFSLKKYTIGLPGLIIKAIRGESPENPNLKLRGDGMRYYTKDEMKYLGAMKDVVELEVNDKDGYVTISAAMPEPILSAQLVKRVQELLQKYITEFKIEKAMVSYNFIKERYNEAKVELDAKQFAYATFQDANKLLTSASSKIKEVTLKSEYDIANSAYNELSVQLIQSEIKVKEDTPTFTIIEPIAIPTLKSAPKTMIILAVFIILGGVIACGLVLFLDFLKSDGQVDVDRIKNWN